MSIWWSHASPLSMSANASTSVTLPSRIDFTSEPARTSPASTVSSTWYSWRALRLRASTLIVSAAGAGGFATGLGCGGGGRRSREGARQDEDAHLGGARVGERAGAGAERRARRHDVVDDEDAPARHPRPVADGERARHLRP